MYEKSSDAFLRVQELVRIVSKFGPAKQQFTSVHALMESSESQEAQLYRAIVRTKEPGERAVLNNLPESFNRERYPKIRTELMDDLYRLVFVLDLKQAGYSEYAQRLNELRKAVFLATTLSAMGSSFVAVDIAEKFIGEARELEEWMPALPMLNILRAYASRSGKAKAFEALSDEYLHTLDLLRVWQAGEIAADRILTAFARSGAEKPWLREQVDKAVAELAPAIEAHRTFKLQWLSLRLRKYAFQISMNYWESLKLADESDALLMAYPVFESKSKRVTNEIGRMCCLLQMRKYPEGKRSIERCESLEAPGTSNWYYLKEWDYVYYMRTEQFEAAREIYMRVKSTKEFTVQPEPLQQKFALFLLWADYFTGRPLPMEKKLKGEKTGDISKGLLRLFPSLKDDQAGFKFSVIVLELFLLRDRGNEFEFGERVESLKVFRSRYLSGIAAEQAGYFIQLLDILFANDFGWKKSELEGRPILEQLIASMDEYGIRGEEIMPYDWTWLKLLEQARKRK